MIQQIRKLHIPTLYSHPRRDIKLSFQFVQYLEQYRNLLLAEDINCQHGMLGDRITDENGKVLCNYLLNSSLINLNVSPTRIVSTIETASDRLILSPAMKNKFLNSEVNKTLPFDHCEIYISFNIQINRKDPTSAYKNYKKN